MKNTVLTCDCCGEKDKESYTPLLFLGKEYDICNDDQDKITSLFIFRNKIESDKAIIAQALEAAEI